MCLLFHPIHVTTSRNADAPQAIAVRLDLDLFVVFAYRHVLICPVTCLPQRGKDHQGLVVRTSPQMRQRQMVNIGLGNERVEFVEKMRMFFL